MGIPKSSHFNREFAIIFTFHFGGNFPLFFWNTQIAIHPGGNPPFFPFFWGRGFPSRIILPRMKDLDEEEIGGNLTWTELGILPKGGDGCCLGWTPGWIPQTNISRFGGFFLGWFFKLFRFQVLPSQSDFDLDEFGPFGGSHFGGKLGNRNLKGKLERYQSKKLWLHFPLYMEFNETNLYFSLDKTWQNCTSIWGAFLPNGAPPSTQTVVGNWGPCSKASELDLADTLLHLLCRRGWARCFPTALLSVLGGMEPRMMMFKGRMYIYIYMFFFVENSSLRWVQNFGGTSRRYYFNPPTNLL